MKASNNLLLICDTALHRNMRIQVYHHGNKLDHCEERLSSVGSKVLPSLLLHVPLFQSPSLSSLLPSPFLLYLSTICCFLMPTISQPCFKLPRHPLASCWATGAPRHVEKPERSPRATDQCQCQYLP